MLITKRSYFVARVGGSTYLENQSDSFFLSAENCLQNSLRFWQYVVKAEKWFAEDLRTTDAPGNYFGDVFVH